MERDNYLLITTRNNTGILQRITGLFSRRFYNILSTVAAQDLNSEFSHLIIVVRGDAKESDCIFVLREEIRTMANMLESIGGFVPGNMHRDEKKEKSDR